MNINHKVLSIPPYISTSWENISSLQSKQEGDKHSLIVYLQNGGLVLVPDLEVVVIQAIFGAHAKFVETGSKTQADAEVEAKKRVPLVQEASTSIKFFEIENISSMMNHNEAEKNAPDLPSYILSKVQEISLEMGLSNSATMQAPEPGCNCPFCQIAKSIQKTSEHDEEEEDLVTEEDLSFTSWIIHPLKPNVYKVVHPDHLEDQYQVFLGSPIGCTCGSNQCEHIKAALSS